MRGRKPKAEPPMPMPTPAKRGRKPKVESPAEIKGKIKRGRKPKIQAPAEIPAKTPARRGRPSLPKGAKSQEVSLNSLTKFANSIVAFCVENGIADPNLDDVRAILNILDKGKALKFEKGGKISRSGKYISKWQIKQILTDGGMKIGSDELLSGVWLKKKGRDVAQMRMGGKIGYFVINDNILESGKSVMLGTRRISAKNRKFQGVFEGKMVGGLMKVYDYDDEMWKVVNPDEWQQAYAEGGELGLRIYDSDGGNVIYVAKNLSLAKLWVIRNWKKYDQVVVEDGAGDSIVVWKEDSLEDIEWLFSDSNYAKGGGVGEFSSKEYDKPRGETDYEVQVEDEEDDDVIIVEHYDNYDEAISAYNRSKYRFPIVWRTYLETQKAPFVYEKGIVLSDGTLRVEYRKGKEVKHDFNGNEIYAKQYAERSGVGILVDKLYAKSKFINDDWDWELKLLELLQDNSIEAYQIYMKLKDWQKESVLQELYEMDNDMGSDGDGTYETSEENLQILLENAKNGKRYAEGGGVGKKSDEYYERRENLEMFLNLTDEDIYEQWMNNELTDAMAVALISEIHGVDFDATIKYAKGGGVRNFTLADYKENEETNNHSENALMLTKMYGTQDEIFEVERLIKKGEREGGFSEVDWRRIYEISGKYYKQLVEASKRK